MKRRILIPIAPSKTELQKKADEYYDRAFDELCYGVERLEHLDKGIILFTYSNFSITMIRELKNGLFRIEEYQTTRCPPQGQGRTVGDALNEEWATESTNSLVVIEEIKGMAFNWN